MQDILIRAGSYVFIIILGIFLRKIGVFKREDFRVLSNLMVKVTLPASIVYNFAGSSVDAALLPIMLIGLISGIICMGIAILFYRRQSKEQQAFAVVNLAGYNISNFTLPFLLGLVGTEGIMTTGLFDAGNAAICLGGSYAVAAMIKDGTGFSLKKIGKALIKMPPFVCFLIMMFMNSTGLKFPAPVLYCAEIIGGANAFVAMLMIGVGFSFTPDREKVNSLARCLIIRYAAAAVLAAVCWFVLPYGIEIKKALVILFFSPIGASAPAFTGIIKEDVGLSSMINSVSILCSLVFMVGFMMIMA